MTCTVGGHACCGLWFNVNTFFHYEALLLIRIYSFLQKVKERSVGLRHKTAILPWATSLLFSPYMENFTLYGKLSDILAIFTLYGKFRNSMLFAKYNECKLRDNCLSLQLVSSIWNTWFYHLAHQLIISLKSFLNKFAQLFLPPCLTLLIYKPHLERVWTNFNSIIMIIICSSWQRMHMKIKRDHPLFMKTYTSENQ